MNRNAISRLVEVCLFAGIALAVVSGGSEIAPEKAAAAKPRQAIATQKLMRNPWDKPIEVASTQARADEEPLYFHW